MKIHVLACAPLLCASLALAHEPAQQMPTRGYFLEGQMLIYPPAISALPGGFALAPKGARAESDFALEIRSLADVRMDAGDVVMTASGPLMPTARPLVLTGAGHESIEVGSLLLQGSGADTWTLFAGSGELQARPVFTLATGGVQIQALSAERFAVHGELFLHPAMAAEIGLAGAAHLPVGALTMTASSHAASNAVVGTPGPSIAAALPSGGTQAVGAGPDVVVSGIGTTLTKNGTVGDTTAYSMTTVSCNIGTTNAIWIDCVTGPNCNQHPVIGQQIHRLKTVNGSKRFEQIGMSWLKHGFCAADVCSCPGGTCTTHSSCDWLGLFATDTYGASLNGSQSNLGPRSEINPWTGVFPYPYLLNWQATGNAIYKRTQVKNADLDPALNAGAQYFGEVVYIATDEPDYHRYNNYSYRPISSSGVDGTTLAFTGSTIWQQPAMQAWVANDPGTVLTDIDVPGDGRLVLGSKVTDLGGGTWHYEYALLNMNLHDSARSFSVPVAGSTTVTNIGFHDVPYHSGEPYDGTDWPGIVSGGALAWSTATFGANPNANALRWSATYNFRFDANSPPTSGTITIGLFRSGGSATVTASVPSAGGIAATFPYCFGDGDGTACPCGNNVPEGTAAGCLNSLGTGGALAASGTASLSADSLVLAGSGMPDSSALYFQGTGASNSGAGTLFGDGLRCASGSVVRLGTKLNTLGSSSYPAAGDQPVSVRGGIGAPGVRTYQVWYRNAAAFCTADTFNLTSAYHVAWGA